MVKEIAEIVGCDSGYASDILKNNGISSAEKKDRATKNMCFKVAAKNPETGEILEFFDSTAEASRCMSERRRGKASSMYSGNISKACRGIRKTYLGFKWEYVNS